jgi:hypothetical protein
MPMNSGSWTVKTSAGDDFGHVTKLIIDATTRQVSYADVALEDGSQIVRVPWKDLEVTHDGIFLRVAPVRLQVRETFSNGQPLVTLEIPKPVLGRIGHSKPSPRLGTP